MGNRTSQCSSKNGPIKNDDDKKVERCFDCSKSGLCEFQNESQWPVTEIPDNCPLISLPEESD